MDELVSMAKCEACPPSAPPGTRGDLAASTHRAAGRHGAPGSQSPSSPNLRGITDRSDPTQTPQTPAETRLHGLYLDAETDGPDDAHDRVRALALLPFTVDPGDWRIVPHLDVALDCPDPHRPAAATTDARARALVERSELLVTHTRGFSLALLVELGPALAKLR